MSIWQNSKVRAGARIGASTRVGGGVYIGSGVIVGERCKIENSAQLFEGARIAGRVFIGPGALLLNDKYPRAVTVAGDLKESDDWQANGVCVDEGASIGAGAILLPGSHVERWALVGAGAVVAGRVSQYALVVGNPARRVGTVCQCGRPVDRSLTCSSCGLHFAVDHGTGLPEVDEPGR